jgi:hypothetical protein
MTARLAIVWTAVWLGAFSARADTGTDALRNALSLARASEYSDAVAALPDTSALSRSHLPLLARVAAALQDQRPLAAMGLLAAERRLDPDATAPRVALETLWRAHPVPAALDAADLPFYPSDAEAISLPARDTLPATRIITVVPRSFLGFPASTEPRSGAAYPRIAGIYVERNGILSLRFTVHFVDAALERRARQAGRWLSAVSTLSDHMLGAASRARYPVSVWLAPGGAPGAEQWAGSIIVHGATADRSGLEWARQLAHEWGHAAIPGGGGFREPEAWAAGDLGERLFLPAMQRAGWLAAWDPSLDAAPYIARFVDPLRAAFAKTGPVARLVSGTDRPSYDHYLGACLYIAHTYGIPALAAAMDDMEGPRTADLLAAFQRTLGARPEWTATAASDVEGGAAVYFPAHGRYILESHAEDGETATRRSHVFDAGWTRVKWSGTMTIRRLAAARKG